MKLRTRYSAKHGAFIIEEKDWFLWSVKGVVVGAMDSVWTKPYTFETIKEAQEKIMELQIEELKRQSKENARNNKEKNGDVFELSTKEIKTRFPEWLL